MGASDAERVVDVRRWLKGCPGCDARELGSAVEIGRGSGCQVWECLVAGKEVVLKIYSPGCDDYSELRPIETARKHALALAEMPVEPRGEP